mmetsp:Transcript_9249/g.24436  ORF Transcript_9249/g.24436 Transcript_9249/m.24436 type:complete len:93 (+) Transcript_9249:1135-1413(+)
MQNDVSAAAWPDRKRSAFARLSASRLRPPSAKSSLFAILSFDAGIGSDVLLYRVEPSDALPLKKLDERARRYRDGVLLAQNLHQLAHIDNFA